MASPNLTTSSESKNEKQTNDKIVVAAIDFGTTFTGFAFSFSDDISQIFTSKWAGENIRTATEKAPTCVLLSPQKEFIAFGFEAEEKYRQLFEEDRESDDSEGNGLKAETYYFFERFKMKLYQTKKLRLDTKLADKHGKELPAIDVFAAVISYLKDKLVIDLHKRLTGFQEDDILWVITVPAIWSDAAKQFMREAAKKAGIEDGVKLILEPEAASLYCNSQKLCKIRKLDETVDVEPFPAGQQYIVADLGGGTADLSVHEILPDRNLKEIHRADGDALGGDLVDQEFFDFLTKVFGTNVIRTLKDKYPDLLMEIQNQFETKKRSFDPANQDVIRLQIPKADIVEIIRALNEDAIHIKVKQASETLGNDTIKLQAGKLCFGIEIMKSFYSKAIDGIINFINKMREDDELGTINTLLLVGGLAESTLVQDAIRCQVKGIRMITPADPSLAVLKGAVIIGRNPKVITERIARFKYGFSFRERFKPGVHPEELKVTQNGVELCKSVFKKLITKGDILKVGDHFSVPAVHSSLSDNFFEMLLMKCLTIVAGLYRSNDPDPKYSGEEYGCELIGLVLIPPPPTGWPLLSLIVQELVVGEAEFTVRGVNINTLEVIEGKVDFLASAPNK